jgi:hypothetical protein
MKRLLTLLIMAFIFCSSQVYAWGSEGHKIVVLIARSQLNNSVIETVNYYLKGMTWEDAACWMDEVQNDPKYEHMKSWHYINIDRDKTYVQTKEVNVVTKLEFCIRMLQYRSLQTDEAIRETIKVLFHLIGDIHQPLHCGYGEDRGGTNTRVYLIAKETNLHRVWDRELIDEKKMDIWHCAKAFVGMKLTAKRRADIERTDVVGWMNESRALLPEVYKITNGRLDQKYIDQNAQVVEGQLIKAGLRLAVILNQYFK